MLAEGQEDAAKAHLDRLQSLFPDRLYIELQRHGLPRQKAVEPTLLTLAYDRDLPLVATNDCYFSSADMYEAHDALLCIAGGTYVAEQDRRRVTPEHRLKTPEEMTALFADIPEAVANTVAVARRCAYMAETRKPILPNFAEKAAETGDGAGESEAGHAAPHRP